MFEAYARVLLHCGSPARPRLLLTMVPQVAAVVRMGSPGTRTTHNNGLKDNTNVLSFWFNYFHLQWCSPSFCLVLMRNAQFRGSAEMSTAPWAESFTEPTGASLRCHMTFPLRLCGFIWWTIPSPPSMLESSATWLNALVCTWNTIRFLLLMHRPSGGWGLFRNYGCPAIRFQFFSWECSQDWTIWESSTWTAIRFQFFSWECSQDWTIWESSTCTTIRFQFFSRECSQDWTIWENSACTTIRFQFFSRECSLDWTIWNNSTCTTIRFQFFSRECSLDWTIWYGSTYTITTSPKSTQEPLTPWIPS